MLLSAFLLLLMGLGLASSKVQVILSFLSFNSLGGREIVESFEDGYDQKFHKQFTPLEDASILCHGSMLFHGKRVEAYSSGVNCLWNF